MAASAPFKGQGLLVQCSVVPNASAGGTDKLLLTITNSRSDHSIQLNGLVMFCDEWLVTMLLQKQLPANPVGTSASATQPSFGVALDLPGTVADALGKLTIAISASKVSTSQ